MRMILTSTARVVTTGGAQTGVWHSPQAVS